MHSPVILPYDDVLEEGKEGNIVEEQEIASLPPWFHYSDDFANTVIDKNRKVLAVSIEVAKGTS